ncbi:farnesyl pyrophosphate synthase-like isoform X2 [Ostrinia nubilalis]|uniref:farnesyl pyrophosphate synthase-like isoform X2 n=1 Tax=Ostrinia nubilalis TaxID=29057 RepID=UPI0030822AAA
MILVNNLRKVINNCTSTKIIQNKDRTRINGSLKVLLLSTKVSSTLQHDEKEKFLEVFPEIVSSIVRRNEKFSSFPGIGNFTEELLKYNSAGGNKTRGLMTVHAYRMLADDADIIEESMKQARILGWYLELWQTALMLVDDIIDGSSTRRGSVCWYRLPHVGARAINDSFIFLSLLCDNAKYNFGNETWYPRFMDYFNENDFLDSFGDEAISGKIGSDIQEGKISWLSVTALQRCDEAQREEFIANYGRADDACVQRIKQLYRELQIPRLYREEERACYENIIARIQALPSDNVIPSPVLIKLLDMVFYMRSKPCRKLVKISK